MTAALIIAALLDVAKTVAILSVIVVFADMVLWVWRSWRNDLDDDADNGTD